MKKLELQQIIREEINNILKEGKYSLMKGSSKSAKERDIEQSDKEYIEQKQKRDKAAQSIYNKKYKDLDSYEKEQVNKKIK